MQYNCKKYILSDVSLQRFVLGSKKYWQPYPMATTGVHLPEYFPEQERVGIYMTFRAANGGQSSLLSTL
jgi:hypothetical protein